MTAPFPARLGSFPPDFRFGSATAAYQIEGAVRQGGRGVSIWDTFSHTPGRTLHGDTGDIACDHFHRWESDLDAMREYDLRAYRFELSWTRLQPAGRGPLNPAGVTFYRSLLEGCHARGIEPLVTLYHWDLPQPLQDAGGWPSRETAHRFADYVALVIEELGDLAPSWITINEPWCVAFLSHAWGRQAPGVQDDRLALAAAHHTLLAHGLALAEIRARRPDLQVGITNINSVVRPATDDAGDVDAARILDIRMNRIFLDPLYLGKYPDDVVEVFGVDGLNAGESPTELVQPGDLELISARTDFVGVNHYHNMVVAADPTAWGGIAMRAAEPTTGSWGWSKTGWALRDILLRIHREYSTLPIVITENGVTCYDYPDPNGGVHDPERIAYYTEYLDAVGEAIEAGVRVTGYMAWSFLDNFEWAEGYSKRFGLFYVDFPTQTRIPKDSARWYAALIRQHRALTHPTTITRADES